MKKFTLLLILIAYVYSADATNSSCGAFVDNDNTSHNNQYKDSIIKNRVLCAKQKDRLEYLSKEIEQCGHSYLFLIDSLLKSDSLTLNKTSPINYSKPLHPDIDKNLVSKRMSKVSPSYPAGHKYDDIWCTRRAHPYPNDLAANDTLVKLVLINDSSEFHMPGEARVSSRFGWRNGRMHNGIDLAIYHYLPIYNTFPGIVRFAGYIYGYGRLVIVRHYNGLETYYAHLSRIQVNTGDTIKAGAVVGNSGNSGTSRGTHLHYEIRYKGVALNPAHIISFTDNKLLHDTIMLKKQRDRFFVYSKNAILYKVQRGDYLYRIAEEYGTTVRRLRETNDIPGNGIIRVGQIIRIEL